MKMHGCCPPFEKPNIPGGFCPCCARALAEILRRIITSPNNAIDIRTTSQTSSGKLLDVIPKAIRQNVLLEVDRNGTQQIVNLCEVVTIGDAKGGTAGGTAVRDVSFTGINATNCGCCEQALTNLFQQLQGRTFDVLTTSPQTDNSFNVVSILAITNGVVKINTGGQGNPVPRIVSLCHVVSLEDITPPLPPSV
ncbi:hypothetical protein [Rubeoparvulum massiliense]|uniref:hypothetical protein n=1 Tax=Rubeoparvulum massiliense TaxID=1631346 RepID=UPI00065E18CE|nr:hypothetical protein [Rubeoparvulum massiliense]